MCGINRLLSLQPRKIWFSLCITEADRCLVLLGFFFELDVLKYYRIMKSEEEFQLHRRMCWFVSKVIRKRDKKVCLGYKGRQTESAASTHIWQLGHTTGSYDDQRWSHSCQQNAFTSIYFLATPSMWWLEPNGHHLHGDRARLGARSAH